MSQQTPTYSFLPWLRVGLANSILTPDADAGVKVRAAIPLDLTLTATKLDGGSAAQVIHKDISLYGPGDLVGLDRKAIIKVEPRNGITNFEPNYLPYVDFYDEDLPWRYTPAAADEPQHRLRPWLALVVLKEGEFKEGANAKGRPLPYFELSGVKAADVFPPPAQLWAWAHVHVNKDLTDGGDASMPGVLARLQSALSANPDQAYSRIVSPRRLEPKVKYYAFLIPTFETGRLAGLGDEVPAATMATASAWDAGQAVFPYYFRWSFVTGTQGDFEFLVKLLKPRPADSRVGVRDMDVLHPGPRLPPIEDPTELGGVLKLGGALRVPFETLLPEEKAEAQNYDEWDEHPYPHPFEAAMAARVNLADDYTLKKPEDANPDHDPDPVVTSPLYGRWHALINRLLTDPDGASLPNRRNWIHELNLDPRFRVAAGLGTKVIQKKQEEYVNAAWAQLGDVIAANNQLRLAEFSLHISTHVYERYITSLNPQKVFVLTAPVHRRVVAQGLTVYGHVQSSVVPYAALSAPFRQATRPGGPLMKRLGIGTPADSVRFVTGLNSGVLVAAPPKVSPPGAIKLSDANAAAEPVAPPPPAPPRPWWHYLLLVAALLLLLLVLLLRPGRFLLLLLLVIVVLLLFLFWWLTRTLPKPPKEPVIGGSKQTPEGVDRLPKVPNFVISSPGQGFVPQVGLTDSEEGVRLKRALKDVYTYTGVLFPQPVKKRLDLTSLTEATLAAIDPAVAIPKRVNSAVKIPFWIKELMVEVFAPVMAYPVFDFPMYKPLSELSSELFLPNINLIPPDSITLLESNQKFIESYMVGLNHEMGRELLWREYMTDQRGSYFRQFWDVSGVLPATPTEDEREKLRDIPKIHRWSKFTELGTHNQRETEGDAAQLVLVIRGELLKKYPRAVIYAQKAQWHKKEDGTPDATVDRDLAPLTAAEEAAEPPPAAKIRKPLFHAKVDPDIYFLGFNLTAAEARGGNKVDEDAGWFFVIKERPGEPRFGFDYVEGDGLPRLVNWNNLTWNHVGTSEGRCIELNKTIEFTKYEQLLDEENEPDLDDKQAQWTPDTNSADLAYILYQVPVLVAVHASRMLP